MSKLKSVRLAARKLAIVVVILMIVEDQRRIQKNLKEMFLRTEDIANGMKALDRYLVYKREQEQAMFEANSAALKKELEESFKAFPLYPQGEVDG